MRFSLLVVCLWFFSALAVAQQSETVSYERAFQLLQQATFGPTQVDIRQVQSLGVEAWLDRQIHTAGAYQNDQDSWLSHLQLTQTIAREREPGAFPLDAAVFNGQRNRNVLEYQMNAWWHNGIGWSSRFPEIGKDQLRQRIAYSLSQLLVVSHTEAPLHRRAEALAEYYDILARNAFGNYRTLLGEVSRSAAMGTFLSHKGSRKTNVKSGRHPDENYAREIMQLFTLGVYQKNLDGSPNYDGNPNTLNEEAGQLVASYSQKDVEELAKVFTGWDLHGQPFGKRLRHQTIDFTRPMQNTARFHEDERAENGDGVVELLGHSINLRTANAESHMDQALDILFAQPNLAPHISRHFITNLVTSNPSSGYVLRVAQVFEDNGKGERGDLAAVVKATLLDPEAATSLPKMKEPFLAYTQLLRVLQVDGGTPEGFYAFKSPHHKFAQAPLRSRSVFNFYNPDYIPSAGFFANNGLFAPEVEIITEKQVIEFNNQVYRLVFQCDLDGLDKLKRRAPEKHKSVWANCQQLGFAFRLSEFVEGLLGSDLNMQSKDWQANYPQALDALALAMLGRPLSPSFKAELETFWASHKGIHKAANPLYRMLQASFYFIATNPEYRVQR